MGYDKIEAKNRSYRTPAQTNALAPGRQLPLPPYTTLVQTRTPPDAQTQSATGLRGLADAAGDRRELYYKLVPGEDWGVMHMFAYWCSGPHAEHYVYSRASNYEYDAAADVLVRKITEVERGERFPSLDTRKGTRYRKT